MWYNYNAIEKEAGCFSAEKGIEIMITLKRAMRILDVNDAWTIGTEEGEGWLFYFDGKRLHIGTQKVTLEELLERQCAEFYEREARKNWVSGLLPKGVCELEAGYAFVVPGNENGLI